MKNRRTRPQKAKAHNLERANRRGVFAVRRRVAPESQESLQVISDILQPEIRSTGRLFDVRTLGVTVVGFSRFDRRHLGTGPPTSEVVRKVLSTSSALEVGLGKLSIYDTETKAKLGVALISEELEQEVEDLEDGFRRKGFSLRTDPNDDGEYAPHCSMALLYTDNLAHYQDPRTLRRLDTITGLSADTIQIVLEPAK